jgi:hypothetical protein
MKTVSPQSAAFQTESTHISVKERPATSGRALGFGFLLSLAHVVILVWLNEFWNFGDPTHYTLVSTIVLFGFILGEFIVGIGWKLVGIIFNIKTYSFYV